MRVLIVDHSSAVRQRLLELISDCPSVERVWQAADAADALEIVRQHPVDAAVLDPALGAHGDLDVISRLRAESARLLIIVLTNSCTDAHREECLRLGAHFFFDKSLDFERAIAVLARVATARRASA